MHTLVDKEDEVEVVQENFKRFQNIYHPILEQEFKDYFSLKDGKFDINHDDYLCPLLRQGRQVLQICDGSGTKARHNDGPIIRIVVKKCKRERIRREERRPKDSCSF